MDVPVVRKIVQITRGFCLLPLKTFTTHDLIHLCDQLTQHFNTTFGTDQYKFVPDDSVEGGVNMKGFPNKRKNMYKGLRIFFYQRYNVASLSLPPETLLTPFDKSTMLKNQRRQRHKYQNPYSVRSYPITKIADAKIRTTMRCYNDAPAWTTIELKMIESVMAQFGLVRKGAFRPK